MEELAEISEGEEDPSSGPLFDPWPFAFLIKEQPETFVQSKFVINRPFKAAVNLLHGPHGSSSLFQGDTSVLCAVYGPSEVRISKELPHRAAVDVLFRHKITGGSNSIEATTSERSIETALSSIFESQLFLEQDMGSGFNIILHEIENDACLFSTCVNAASLALLNAGCSLRSVFAGVTLLVSDDVVIVDPNSHQIRKTPGPLITFVYENGGALLYVNVTGRMSQSHIKLCAKQAFRACQEIFEFFKLLLQTD